MPVNRELENILTARQMLDYPNLGARGMQWADFTVNGSDQYLPNPMPSSSIIEFNDGYHVTETYPVYSAMINRNIDLTSRPNSDEYSFRLNNMYGPVHQLDIGACDAYGNLLNDNNMYYVKDLVANYPNRLVKGIRYCCTKPNFININLRGKNVLNPDGKGWSDGSYWVFMFFGRSYYPYQHQTGYGFGDDYHDMVYTDIIAQQIQPFGRTSDLIKLDLYYNWNDWHPCCVPITNVIFSDQFGYYTIAQPPLPTPPIIVDDPIDNDPIINPIDNNPPINNGEGDNNNGVTIDDQGNIISIENEDEPLYGSGNGGVLSTNMEEPQQTTNINQSMYSQYGYIPFDQNGQNGQENYNTENAECIINNTYYCTIS